MSDLVALLFGAAIVLLFSYERFNKATYEDARQLERLVDLLTPDKLRARRIVLQAYLFYAGALILIYFFLCAYAEVLPNIGGPDLGAGSLGASQLPTPPSESAERATTGFTPRGDGINIDWMQPLSSGVEPAASRSPFDIGIDPSISLAIALIVVGLAPSFPILRRFEDWMRGAALQLAGIPTHVIDIRDALRRNYLGLTEGVGTPDPDKTLLIPRGDWDRMKRYWEAAKDQLNAPDEFRHDLELIFAVSAWFLERKFKVANPQERERFGGLEDMLRRRTEELIRELDERLIQGQPGTKKDDAPAAPEGDGDGAKDSTEKAGRGKKSGAAAASGPDGSTHAGGDRATDELTRWSWERLAKKADELADDLCILLALYIEHGVILAPDYNLPTGDATSGESKTQSGDLAAAEQAGDDKTGEWTTASGDLNENTLRDPVRQQRLVHAKLIRFLKGVHQDGAMSDRLPSFTTLGWLWTFGAVVVVTLLWSILPPGRFEAALQRPDGSPGSAYMRAVQYTIFAFTSYCIPMIVALAIRDGGRRSHRWRNFWWRHWTIAVPQALLVLTASWTVATLFLVGVNLWQVGVDFSWADTEGWSKIRSSFEYNAPYTMRGAALALIVVLLLDAHAAAPRSREWSKGSSATRAAYAALIMGLVGAVTRYATAWAAALNAQVPRVGLDEIDRGLVVYAALYSALIGFCVVYCVAEAVQNSFRSTVRTGDRGRKSRGTGRVEGQELEKGPGVTPVGLLLVFATALAAAVSPGSVRAQEPRITIGVRVDARPFIWKQEGEKDPEADPVGFLWHMCREAVERTKYDSVEVDVEADDRAAFLNEGRGGYDLLCDPTTITLERLKNFSDTGNAPELEFSPIVFVANGSFVQQDRTAAANPWRKAFTEGEAVKPPDCVELEAFFDNQNMASDPPLARGWSDVFDITLRRDKQIQTAFTHYEFWGYVVGATIGRTVRSTADASSRGTKVCARELPSHKKAAEEFCTGRLARYFGDVEIVRAAIEEYLERPGARCAPDYSQTTEGSYEPYAFVVASRIEEFPERFALALYSMFADGTVETFFVGSFPDESKSQYLATLFRINSIPPGDP